METPKKLYRSRTDRIIAGVCGGLGKYFEIDPLLMRIAFVMLVFANGFGIILYIILMVIVPLEEGEPVKVNTQEAISSFAEKAGERIQSVAQEVGGQIKYEMKLDDKQSDFWSHRRNQFGAAIVVFGILLLINQFIPIFSLVNWKLFWPVAIILLGVFIITKNK